VYSFSDEDGFLNEDVTPGLKVSCLFCSREGVDVENAVAADKGWDVA
jgi:hypothetical protein